MGQCVHEKGKIYDGQLCYASLEQATDAFEFSFVAVPAQREAGVIKGQKRQYEKLAELVREHPGCGAELERLEREAKAGRSYLDGLRRDVVRLGGLAERDLDVAVLRDIADKLEERELLELKRTFEGRAQEKYALKPQLEYGRQKEQTKEQDGAFLI
jgi:predicted nuclease with TOPRIM domain